MKEREDVSAFKNYIQAIWYALDAQALRRNDVNDLLQFPENLLNDQPFWHRQRAGPAVFRSPAYFAVFYSLLPFADGHRLYPSPGWGHCCRSRNRLPSTTYCKLARTARCSPRPMPSLKRRSTGRT